MESVQVQCRATNMGVEHKSVPEKKSNSYTWDSMCLSATLRQGIGGFIFGKLECLHTPKHAPLINFYDTLLLNIDS